MVTNLRHAAARCYCKALPTRPLQVAASCTVEYRTLSLLLGPPSKSWAAAEKQFELAVTTNIVISRIIRSRTFLEISRNLRYQAADPKEAQISLEQALPSSSFTTTHEFYGTSPTAVTTSSFTKCLTTLPAPPQYYRARQSPGFTSALRVPLVRQVSGHTTPRTLHFWAISLTCLAKPSPTVDTILMSYISGSRSACRRPMR